MATVSELFDPREWRVVEGFDPEGITYHRHGPGGRDGVDVPVAADESVRRASDPQRLALAGAADVVVVKVAPLAGVRRALAVADACGLPVVVSSALDTSVGLAAGVALAATLPRLPYACGLGTRALLAHDVAAPGLLPHDGLLHVGAVTPDAALLAQHAAPPDRQAWWRDRLRRCAEHLRAAA